MRSVETARREGVLQSERITTTSEGGHVKRQATEVIEKRFTEEAEVLRMENQETTRDTDAQDDARRHYVKEIIELGAQLAVSCRSTANVDTLFYVSTLLRQANQALVEDPILELGRNPIDEDVTDASLEHDRYIYRQ